MAPGSLWKDVNLEGSENIEAMDLMSNERIEATAEKKFQLGFCRNAWLVKGRYSMGKKRKVMEIIHRAATALLSRSAVLQFSTALARTTFFSRRAVSAQVSPRH